MKTAFRHLHNRTGQMNCLKMQNHMIETSRIHIHAYRNSESTHIYYRGGISAGTPGTEALGVTVQYKLTNQDSNRPTTPILYNVSLFKRSQMVIYIYILFVVHNSNKAVCVWEKVYSSQVMMVEILENLLYKTECLS